MFWRLTSLLLLVVLTAQVTVVLTSAHYGAPITSPLLSLVLPVGAGVGCFCNVVFWLSKVSDDE